MLSWILWSLFPSQFLLLFRLLSIYEKQNFKSIEKHRIWYWSRHKHKKEKLINLCMLRFKLMFACHITIQWLYKSRKSSKDMNKQFTVEHPWVDSHLKRCSTSLVIKELCITTILRYHFTVIGKKWKQKKTTWHFCMLVSLEYWALIYFAGGSEIYVITLESGLAMSSLFEDSYINSVSGYYILEEFLACVLKETCRMLNAELFLIVKTRNQCPLEDG